MDPNHEEVQEEGLIGVAGVGEELQLNADPLEGLVGVSGVGEEPPMNVDLNQEVQEKGLVGVAGVGEEPPLIVDFVGVEARIGSAISFARRVLSSVGGNTLLLHGVHLVALDRGFRLSAGVEIDLTSGFCRLTYRKPGCPRRAATLLFQENLAGIHVTGSLCRTPDRVYELHFSESYVRDFLISIINICGVNIIVDDILLNFEERVRSNLIDWLVIQEVPSAMSDLPDEIMSIVLSYCRGVDIARIESVCSWFRRLSMEDDILWALKFKESFPSVEIVSPGQSWKICYARHWIMERNFNLHMHTSRHHEKVKLN